MDKFECDDVVAEATNYFEGSMGADEMTQMADHLRLCWACVNYMGEVQLAVRLMSELPAEQISGDLETALMAMFRQWAASVTV